MLSLLWCRLLIVSSILLCDVADEGSAPPASADAKVAAEPSSATQPPTKTEQPPRPATDQRQPPQRSAYVDKMLQQDRNKDGRLSKEELPASQHHLWKHDLNDDGLLGPRELAAIEAGTAEDGGRPDAGERPGDGRSGPAGLRGSRRGAGGRGLRGGQRGPQNSGPGSAAGAVDAQQILRFALTFDVDQDGGLNAAELRKYANALAARRARGRRQQGGEDPARRPPQQQSAPAKGLGDPSTKDDPNDPFGGPPVAS